MSSNAIIEQLLHQQNSSGALPKASDELSRQKSKFSKISKKARGTRAPPLLVPFRGLKIGQNFVEMVPEDRVRHEDSENHLGKSKRRSDGRTAID